MPKVLEITVLPLVEKLVVKEVVLLVIGMPVERDAPVVHSSTLPFTIEVEAS